ncbi:ABC transporter ATP-binding protein [Georgenia yuyongxinii]|nr:ABC transporter ATP-binding protein [Georgenia yuyongxinii]
MNSTPDVDGSPRPGTAVAQSSEPAVTVSGVFKTYATRDGVVEAVRDVSFEVPHGHVVSMVGPSGCGKSTVLKMIAGLETYDRGTITVRGSDPAPGRRDCGIMMQSAVLLPWRTVRDNVMLPVEILGLDKSESAQRTQDLLELVGLQGFEKKFPWELSGGMQQRVSLARLLVFEPQLLLMDEPFAALDEMTRERLDLELVQLHERFQRTLIYVTHNIAEAVLISDTVIVMTARPGEIVDIVPIDLPRPRTIMSTTTPEGTALIERIRRALDGSTEEEVQ